MQSFRHIREVGNYGSGRVIEVGKEEKYALKMMNAGDGSISSQRSFINEIEKLKILCHPNIIRAHGIFLSDETTPFSILLELCSSDVQHKIKQNEHSKVARANIIYQISARMRYVHSRRIIHRDLKPQNTLIGMDGLIRISDFGISKLICIKEQSTSLGAGTLPFMAPELLNDEKYDFKVDVYSFGVVVFFIVSNGELPKINIVQVGNIDEFYKIQRNLLDSQPISRIVELLNFISTNINNNETSTVLNELADKCANRFYEMSIDELKTLEISTIEMIMSSSNLQLRDEDFLVEMIIKLTRENKNKIYFSLFEYVFFNNITRTKLEEFINEFDIEYLNKGTWTLICDRLLSRKRNKISIQKVNFMLSNSFDININKLELSDITLIKNLKTNN